MGVYVIHNLIHILAHTHGGMIMTLVYVLVNVLDGLDGGTDLDIDVAVVPCEQIKVVGNNNVVVKGVTFMVSIGPAIVRPGIFEIAVFAKTGFRTELFWIMLAAFSIDHAGSIWFFWTTGTMHHWWCRAQD
jgi:hypothetical protein